jgi:hypothetical protein
MEIELTALIPMEKAPVRHPRGVHTVGAGTVTELMQ